MDRHQFKHLLSTTFAPIAFGVFLIICASIYFAEPDVRYRSSDANWADYEINFKNRGLEQLVYNFEGYKIICDRPDAILYRTTKPNWFNIFAWNNYWHDRKWHVPYAPPVESIGDYYPRRITDKHCYNKPWKPDLLAETRKNMQRYLKELDRKVAESRRAN